MNSADTGSLPAAESYRTVCYRCDKAYAVCICASVPRVDNRTAVTVLQHPRERRHPLGTVRFLRLALQRLNLEVCWDVRLHASAQAQLAQPGCAVLYPHSRATPLGEGPLPRHLIVLDGTWSQARALHRENAWLHNLPHHAITPDGVDRYRIRREPGPECTSTLEAVVQALQIIEPDTPGLNALLASFSAMIARQVDCVGHALPRPSRKRPRKRYLKALWRNEDLVLTYAESTRGADPTRRDDAELVYFTAHHPASGRTLACVRRPPVGRGPTAAHLAHMGLSAEALPAGLDDAALAQAWRAFAPPTPLVLAWNSGTLDLCRRHVDPALDGRSLKAMYCNITRGACGHLEEVLARHGLRPCELPCDGRAGLRLGGIVAVARWLQERCED